MKRLLLALGLLLGLAVPAAAQCTGVFPSNTACANTGLSSGVPKPTLFSSIIANLPLTNTHLFVGDSNNLAKDVALSRDCTMANTGAITCLKTNNVPFGTAAVQDTGTSGPTIPFLDGVNSWSGLQSYLAGVKFLGSSSGDVTILPQANAGTVALTLPNTSGTIPSTAASPLVLSNTTGQISCPTCTTGPGSLPLTQNHIVVGNASNVGADVAMSGDATIVSSGALTLATVNSNVGSFGSSTAIPNFTVNAKGLVTAAGTSAVIAPAGTLTGTTLAANVVSSSLTSVGTIGTGTWQGTTVGVPFGGTGKTTFSANLPLIGNGTGAIAQGTRSGNTTTFATTTGTLNNGNCVSIDASGNLVDAGGACATVSGQGFLYATDFGVLCDNSTDDTANLQTAVNAAVASSSTLVMPGGVCLVSSQITFSGTMTLLGQGHGASSGGGGGTVFSPQSQTQNVFVITGSQPVYFSKFTIQSTLGQTAGSAFLIDSGSATQNFGTRLDSISVYNMWIGFNSVKGNNWTIVNSNFLSNISAKSCMVQIDDTQNFDSGGDAIINTRFIQGAFTATSADLFICQYSQGDIRIVGNNFVGGYGAYYVNLTATSASGQLVIADNTFDGPTNFGINFTTPSPSNTSYQNVTVTGNVFRLPGNAVGITSNAGSTPSWFRNFTITGNSFAVGSNGGGTGTGIGITLDYVSRGTISGNLISNDDSSANAKGIVLGSNASLVTISPDNMLTNFTTANTITDNSSTKGNYAYGTWTPALKFGGASTGMTYSTQSGTYTRLGNTVHYDLFIQLSAKGSSTGAATITGAPYTVNTGCAGFASLVSNMSSLTAGLAGFIGGNATTIQLTKPGTAGTTNATDANFASNTGILLSLTCNL